MYEFYKGTQEVHKSKYLEEEFEKKDFWHDNAKYVDWKIRYQGAKFHPKISGKWEQLKNVGVSDDSHYVEFNITVEDY